ncbi:F-box/WD repeat-containing protein 5-like [Mercenaria mercenaria]|uniref:F-box/WD repeat-containing protein 5-like n=1 Tax=Mercenaria mercenaria TaxID=6596 RepID=UPI00234F0145|nr:F-box/WD repeat-containing protein 5-like [Mercenaria mercenaria]
MESAWQSFIPDSLLLDIFSYLDIKGLGCAAQVCTTWRRVVADEFLWQNIGKKLWNIKGGLAPGKLSWYEEVKRLTYHVPTVCYETIEKHTDEVLDVSISHSGEYFCTCSKDALVIMWKLGTQTSLVKSFDAGLFLRWQLSQYSTFCPDDSLILVCGVKSYDDIQVDMDTEYRAGVGAVFTVPDLEVVSVVEMDPPTMFGAWLNERVFLGGWPGSRSNTVDIQAFKVSDDKVSHPFIAPDNSDVIFTTENKTFAELAYSKNGFRLFTFQGNRYHLMNLLVANVPVSDICTSTSCDMSRSCDVPMSCDSGSERLRRKRTPQYDECFEVPEARKVKVKDSKYRTDFSEGACDRPCNIHAVENSSCEVCDTHNSKNSSSGYETCKFCGSFRESSSSTHFTSDIDLEKESMDSSTLPQKEADNPYKSVSIYERTEPRCQNIKQYVSFVTKNHDVIAVHEVTAEKLRKVLEEKPDNDSLEDSLEDPDRWPCIDKIDHSFYLKDCYITGLCLSHDHRYLYFNFREMDKSAPENKVDDPDDELPVSEKVFCKELKIGCIDLVGMERVKDIEFTGHLGFSTFPAWYICLDACPDYIGSGSEDMRGYLWDRHYRVCIGRLFHSTLDTGDNTLLVMSMHENSVVNGLAFSPVDQETCITVCDDRLIKIWRSKHQAKSLLKASSKSRTYNSMKEKLNKLKTAFEASLDGHT